MLRSLVLSVPRAALVLAWALALAAPTASRAMPPQARFERIELLADGTILIAARISYGSGEWSWIPQRTLIDDDGMATLASINFLLTQDAAEQFFGNGASWAEVRNEPVPGWAAAKEVVHFALRKLHGSYADWAVQRESWKPAAELAARKLQELEQVIGRESISYGELNLILGELVAAYGRRHGYGDSPLFANSIEDPLAASLASRPPTLPPETMSFSRTLFEVDFPELMRRARASLSSPAPVPGGALPEPSPAPGSWPSACPDHFGTP